MDRGAKASGKLLPQGGDDGIRLISRKLGHGRHAGANRARHSPVGSSRPDAPPTGWHVDRTIRTADALTLAGDRGSRQFDLDAVLHCVGILARRRLRQLRAECAAEPYFLYHDRARCHFDSLGNFCHCRPGSAIPRALLRLQPANARRFAAFEPLTLRIRLFTAIWKQLEGLTGLSAVSDQIALRW